MLIATRRKENIIYFNQPLPSVTDNCSYTLTQTDGSGLSSGDVFPVGATIIEFTAVDPSGNLSVMSFTVTIADDEYPVLTDMPLGVSQSSDIGLCGAQVTWQEPQVSDNCIVDTIVTSHSSGDVFPVGNTTVTYDVSDSYGNSVSSSFDIFIIDTEDPNITKYLQ